MAVLLMWRSLIVYGFLGSVLLQASPPFQPPSACADARLEGWGAGTTVDGSILFQVDNEGPQGSVRMCVFDESNLKRVDETQVLPGGSRFEFRVEVPRGAYYAQMEFRFGSTRLTSGNAFSLATCASASMIAPARLSGEGTNVGVEPQQARCDTYRVVPHQVPSRDINPWARQALVWTGLGSFGALALALAIPRPRYALLLLFSRVQGSAVLDQPRRADIYDLIRQDPGIHANRIRERLDLGSGETYYHLEVLRRNGVVVEMRRGGLRCFFDRGLASPEQLQATAALRHEPTLRIYEAVRARPGSSISDLALTLRMTPGSVSKSIDRLASAGLATRRIDGRLTRVDPTTLEPIVGWRQAEA